MPSTIDPDLLDPTKPLTGNPSTANVRANEAATQENFRRAVTDIEELQPLDVQTAKGDLIAHDGTIPVRQPAGTDGHLVAYDSAQTSGLTTVDPGTVGRTTYEGLNDTPAGYGNAGDLVSSTGSGHQYIDPGTVGVTVHGSLTGRSDANQHPIAAIDTLQTELDARMKIVDYDTNASGIVDTANSRGFLGTNTTGGPLAVGELIQFDSGANITAKANASTGTWAYAFVGEPISNGAKGTVIQAGIVEFFDTSAFAVGDVVFCGDAGTITSSPPTAPTGETQAVGVVLSSSVTGVVEAIMNAPELPETEGAAGLLALTDVAGSFTHVQSSAVAWEELTPGAGETALLVGVNTAIGSNPGRLALDFSGATHPPADGTISGTVIASVSIAFTSQNTEMDVAVALNGVVGSPDARQTLAIGGNQVIGTTLSATCIVPLASLDDGAEFSIVSRADVSTYSIEALTIEWISSGGSASASGGGTNDHSALINRALPGSHPATAVSVAPTGGIAATDAQAALAELDSEKADKTSGVTNGELASLVSNNLAGSGLATATVTSHIADTSSNPHSVAHSQTSPVADQHIAHSGVSLTGQNSVSGGGDISGSRTFELTGDEATPGANRVYGTDGAGARGWKDDPASSGDVAGPVSAVDNNFAAFDGVTGKLIKDSAASGSSFDAAGAASDVQGNLDTHTGTGNIHVNHQLVSVAGGVSLDGGGTIDGNQTITLLNDLASPGNNQVYGTNGVGTKGWKSDPAGGSGDLIQGTTGSDGDVATIQSWAGKTVQGSQPLAQFLRTTTGATVAGTAGFAATGQNLASAANLTPTPTAGQYRVITGSTAITVTAMTEDGFVVWQVPTGLGINLGAYEAQGSQPTGKAGVLLLEKVGTSLVASWLNES